LTRTSLSDIIMGEEKEQRIVKNKEIAFVPHKIGLTQKRSKTQ